MVKSPNTVYVGRPTKWGNPYSHKQLNPCRAEPIGRQWAVELFIDWLVKGINSPPMHRDVVLNRIRELKGKNLACWCATPFEPVERGGHVKKFCSKPCKSAFETAARRYAYAMHDAGFLSIDDLKRVSASRATDTAPQPPLRAVG